MFIISLGNKFELESTPRSQAVRTLEHGLLNQPISYTSYYLLWQKNVGHYALGYNTKYTLSRSLGDIALAFKNGTEFIVSFP